MLINLSKGNHSKLNTYILAATIILLGAILYWVTGDRSISCSILDSEYLFSDYFYHINYAALNADIYMHPELPVCLPPLAYLIYTFLWRLVPGPYSDGWTDMRTNDNSLVVFLMANIIVALLLFLLVYSYFKNKSISVEIILVFSLLILFSYPCMNTSIQRGNMVLFVAILLGFAFFLMNQESKIAREVALILIALAAGLKTYPALCGLFYLSQKRYKEAIRLVIYGVVFCLLPFACFGGINGFFGFLNNVSNYASGSFSRWCTLRGYFGMTLKQIGFDSLNEEKLNVIALFMETIFSIFMIFMMVISKKEWKKNLYLMAIVVLVPSGNWMYTLVYLLIPFLMLLGDERENDWGGLTYKFSFAFFTIIFCQPFFFETGLGRVMNWGSVGWLYSCLFMLLLINVIEDIKLIRKNGEVL